MPNGGWWRKRTQSSLCNWAATNRPSHAHAITKYLMWCWTLLWAVVALAYTAQAAINRLSTFRVGENNLLHINTVQTPTHSTVSTCFLLVKPAHRYKIKSRALAESIDASSPTADLNLYYWKIACIVNSWLLNSETMQAILLLIALLASGHIESIAGMYFVII